MEEHLINAVLIISETPQQGLSLRTVYETKDIYDAANPGLCGDFKDTWIGYQFSICGS